MGRCPNLPHPGRCSRPEPAASFQRTPRAAWRPTREHSGISGGSTVAPPVPESRSAQPLPGSGLQEVGGGVTQPPTVRHPSQLLGVPQGPKGNVVSGLRGKVVGAGRGFPSKAPTSLHARKSFSVTRTCGESKTRSNRKERPPRLAGGRERTSGQSTGSGCSTITADRSQTVRYSPQPTPRTRPRRAR